MWAPSMGLTFKAISTTCRDRGKGRWRDKAQTEGEHKEPEREAHTQDDVKVEQNVGSKIELLGVSSLR